MADEILNENDMIAFIYSIVGPKNGRSTLVDFVLNSYNYFIDEGLEKELTNLFHIKKRLKNNREGSDYDRSIESYDMEFYFINIKIGMPLMYNEQLGCQTIMTPYDARKLGKTYSSDVRGSIVVKLTANFNNGTKSNIETTVNDLLLFKIPIMVGSHKCHTYGKTLSEKRNMKEDVFGNGGYFITKNLEWYIPSQEGIRFNYPRIHRSKKPKIDKYFVKCSFISQYKNIFSTSDQLIITYNTDETIVIEINSTKISAIKLPFYILFRMLGVKTDTEIIELCVGSDKNKRIESTIIKAIQLPYPYFTKLQNVIDELVILDNVGYVVNKITNIQYKQRTGGIAWNISELRKKLDEGVLSHLGSEPKDRMVKARMLGSLIRKTLLTGTVYPETDRDSYGNKIVHRAGELIGKAAKKIINISITFNIRNVLKNELDKTPFNEITEKLINDIVISAHKKSDPTVAFSKIIIPGDEISINKNNRIKNTVQAQILERKNLLNINSAMRTIITSGGEEKQKGERAQEKREVHPSFLRFICPATSADTGEKVGKFKQLSIQTTITDTIDDDDLDQIILSNIPDLKSRYIDNTENFTPVYLNGKIIAYTNDYLGVVKKCRSLRRNGIINNKITVYYNILYNEIELWSDEGRLVAPAIIVYNNIDEYLENQISGDKTIKFKQWINYTKDLVKKIYNDEIVMDDLIKMGVCEYISPRETENCYIAPSIDAFYKNIDNPLAQFTHVEVEAAIYGLAALRIPFSTYNQPVRNTYSTQHAKTDQSWYTSNPEERPMDKNRVFQFTLQKPLVGTITNYIDLPSGLNLMAGYIPHGSNQEDSLVFKREFISRGGYGAAIYKTEKSELIKDEQFEIPSSENSVRNPRAINYSKLQSNCLVAPGSLIENNDVIIGKILKRKTTDKKMERIDTSVVYNGNTPAVVLYSDIITNDNGVQVAHIQYTYDMPLNTGDKLSSREGNKGICALTVYEAELMVRSDGVTPDIIFNPHCFPTRMIIAQAIESAIALLCIKFCYLTDATAFKTINRNCFAKLYESLGLSFTTLNTVFNPNTGLCYDSKLNISPVFQGRLQKYGTQEQHVVGDITSTDNLTGQPQQGKRNQGGLRIGEMEKDIFVAHNALNILKNKFYEDSDGRYWYMCCICNKPAPVNEDEKIYECIECGNSSSFAKLRTGKSAQVFYQKISAAGINVELIPEALWIGETSG